MPGRHVTSARRPHWLAAITLALIVLGLLWPVPQAAEVRDPSASGSIVTVGTDRITDSDVVLYRRILARTMAGQPYHGAAVAEQRANDYPVRPFVTVRLPTLNLLAAGLGEAGLRATMLLLFAGTLAAWRHRLAQEGFAARDRAWVLAAVGIGTVTLLRPDMLLWHEAWAAMLVALSLAVWTPGQPWPAALAACLAVSIRETALLYPAVMGAFALRDSRRVDALAWLLVGFVAALLLVLHAVAVAQFVSPADPVSPEWMGLGGWPMVLSFLHQSGPFRELPSVLSAVLVPVSLVGLVTWQSPVGRRVAAVVLAYCAMFSCMVRPNNFYWALLIAPLVPIGWALAAMQLRAQPTQLGPAHAAA